jgi:tetratricopeptide (TPR) repeat protein
MIEQAVSDSEHARLGDSRSEMLQLLYDQRWKDRNGQEPGRWWRQLSLSLLEHGKPDQAFEVAAHITDPMTLVALQADKRYQRIAKSEFVERNVQKAAEKELTWWQAASQQAPRSLARVVGVARALIELHRYDEVLSLTNLAMQQKEAAGPGTVPYDDWQQEFPWLLNVRARGLRALERNDEAVTLLRQACEESRQDMVSHCLNLASVLAGLDRPQEALAVMPSLETASSYGHAIACLIRTMAASEVNDPETVTASLEELRTYTADSPSVLQRGLLVAGKQDEATAVLVSRLTDPALRTDALVELQDYLEPPAPARVRRWRQQLTDLRTSSEVSKLIAAYGNIGRYPLPGPTF